MLPPVRENQDPPASLHRLPCNFDYKFSPSGEISDVRDHLGHVNLPEPGDRWRLLERRVLVGNHLNLGRLHILSMDSKEFRTQKPVEDPRQTILAFGSGRESQGILGTKTKHGL